VGCDNAATYLLTFLQLSAKTGPYNPCDVNKGAMVCRTGGTPMEGAMQVAMEIFFRYYSNMTDALSLNFVLKLMMGK
jgi:hypothetical protein